MTIIVVPTERCNFRCTGCFEPDEVHEGVGLEYSFNAIKKSLMDVWSGPYNGSDVCLHGGEPLLTPLPELEKLLNLIYNLPWKDTGKPKGAVSIVTNGSLITDKHIELFKKYNVYIGLSCDGPPKSNIHRGPDPSNPKITADYNRDMVALIKKLKNEGLNVSIMCILHKYNAGSKELRQKLLGWLVWLKKQGITGGRLNAMYSDRHPELELSNQEVYQMWVNLYHFNKRHGAQWNPIREMVSNLRREKGKHDYFFPKPCTHNRCNPFNTHTLSILPDGTIGCCDRTFNHGIYVRSSDGKKCGRYEALEQTECNGCHHWDICGGGCPEEGVGGDWRHKTRFCEAIKKTYNYLAEQEGITVVICNQPHADMGHGDSAHGDNAHGDSTHGNEPHGDMPHGDSHHGDSPDWRD